MKILIIEDELEMVESIKTYLGMQHYVCDVAMDLKTALERISDSDYDCILLDLGLPGGNGLSVLQELKRNRKGDGLIIISAKNSLTDRITGLQMGADDYLAKPFHLSELNARITSVVRRRQLDGNQCMILNDISINIEERTVLFNNQPVDLTRTEFELLLYLAFNKNKVVSKNAIAQKLFEYSVDLPGNTDFIYAHVKNLKKKMTAAGGGEHIKSIYGMGYKFVSP